MNEEIKIEQSVKVGAEGCCCTGSGSWCRLFFEKKDKSTVSHPVTPALRPDSAVHQPPHLDLETPRR